MPQAPDFAAIARRLYDRRAAAVVIPYQRDPMGRFRRNNCHENCARWTDLYPADDIIRGWLVLDYTNVNNRFRFMPHSIIRAETGARFDLTVQSPYPFLEIETPEDEFVQLVNEHAILWLDHML